MSGAFVSASKQYLIADRGPVSLAPFTMACWAKPTFAGNGGGNQCAMTLSNVAGNDSNWSLGVDGTPEWWFRCANTNSSQADELDISAGVVANTWQFAMARCTTNTNRSLHILNANGTIQNGNTTVSVAPTTITNMAIGNSVINAEINTSPFDGLIGEAWVANIDVWPDGGVIDPVFFRYLAWNGPWAVPRIAAAIQVYKPLRQTLGTGTDVPDENFTIGIPPVWTNTNGVTLAPNPQLQAVYPRPSDTRRYGVI